ncbi:MAG: oligoendopeptidase F [Candidatus Borkfalkiaceae bacterium]|nr:oligoendopeptidase F [Clostridia bacterium]MDY6224032.1 oligoendopeptidase F [Christensenellaceae bacterium]
MERSEVEEKYRWNVEEIYPSYEAWQQEKAEVEQKYVNYDYAGTYKGKLGDKKQLLALFSMQYEGARKAEKLYLYASMKRDEDLRNAKWTSAVSVMQSLFSEFMAKTSFIEPELTALPEEKLKEYIADKDFADYDYILQRIEKSKKYVLSEGEEKLLAMASEATDGYHAVFSMLDNADLNLPEATLHGKKEKITHGGYGLALRTGNAAERKEWFEKYYGAYIRLIHAISQTYYGNVKKDVFFCRARGYENCLSMALHGEDVPAVVYDNLISAVTDALPLMHRYIALRKKTLGLKEQHMYDIYVPLVENAEIGVSYEEAYEIVVEGLAPLGKEYQALLRRAKDERWIDVCESEGKKSGAYSTGAYDTHPYVLLNYQKTTNDIFTIAHEMGHSIHTYKSSAAQPYPKADYTIFLAEIASTVNEVLLLKHLLKNAKDKKTEKYLLNYYMDMIRATLFRQTQFAQFEQIVHKMAEDGEPLTDENLCAVYYDLNKKYYGDAIVHDKEIAYEWARIPHFYRSFYVYKYATGIISAISIVRRVLDLGESAVNDYFAFLSGGSSTDPVSILKRAGVDLTSKKPFEDAMKEFEETLSRFESLGDE